MYLPWKWGKVTAILYFQVLRELPQVTIMTKIENLHSFAFKKFKQVNIAVTVTGIWHLPWKQQKTVSV